MSARSGRLATCPSPSSNHAVLAHDGPTLPLRAWHAMCPFFRCRGWPSSRGGQALWRRRSMLTFHDVGHYGVWVKPRMIVLSESTAAGLVEQVLTEIRGRGCTYVYLDLSR